MFVVADLVIFSGEQKPDYATVTIGKYSVSTRGIYEVPVSIPEKNTSANNIARQKCN